MVTVYGKNDCQQCRATERFLTQKNVEYRKVDVTLDTRAYEHVASLGYQSVPVVELDNGEHFSGFNPNRLAALV